MQDSLKSSRHCPDSSMFFAQAEAGIVGSAERAERDALLRTALEQRTAVQVHTSSS